MTDAAPRTEAGRDLLFMLRTHDTDDLNMEARVRAIEAEAAQGAAAPPTSRHEPLGNGQCRHRWRNRQTRVVACAYAEGWRAAQGAAAPPDLDVERVERGPEWPPAVTDGVSLPCSDCGTRPRFDYHVSEDFWRQWGDGPNVLCLPCLDRRSGGVGLAAAIEQVQWTGTGHTVVLRPQQRYEYEATDATE